MKVLFTLMCGSFIASNISAEIVEEKVVVKPAPVVEEKVYVEHPHHHHYHDKVEVEVR